MLTIVAPLMPAFDIYDVVKALLQLLLARSELIRFVAQCSASVSND